MHLSRLTLNPRTRRVQRELANPYELHRTLLRAYPDELPDAERILYRVETDPRSGVPAVLLQSHARPDWAWLGEPGARDYLLAAPQTKAFELTLTPGQLLAFRLRANPTARRRLPDGSRKRVGLYDEEEQIAWLQRKGESGGFLVRSVRVGESARVTGWARCRPKKGEHKQAEPGSSPKGRRCPLTLLSVQYDGLLQIADADALWRTVQGGIGSAKGFGFGLLSLARPPA